MSHKKLVKFRSSWGWIQVFIMTLAILLSIYPVYNMDPGIDLLSELNLYKNFSKYHGVSLTTQSYHNSSMAFQLETNERKLMLPQLSYNRIAELIRKSTEFTLSAILKQQKGNVGSIIAFSYGSNRYLELESSGKRDEIRFHYSYQAVNGQLLFQTETFSYHLADGNWHKIALSVSGPEIQLLIDCHPLYKRVNHFIPDRNFSASNMQLFVGQRNAFNHSTFKGCIQSAHVIVRPHGYLTQCPHMHEQCPTCAQFSFLQKTIDELQRNLLNLTQRLVDAESRVSRLEECECKISCNLNDIPKEDGTEWIDGCNICKCNRGSITCKKRECEPIECKNPVYNETTCCPVCLKNCYLKKTPYEHGEIHKEGCKKCTCHDGSMRCEEIECQTLNCSSGEQIKATDECCPVCKGDDYCSKGHACHTNATCLNLYTKYTCTCHQGFHGDGFQCLDVDECAEAGGLTGNHCHYNTECVNTQGSYECKCLSGYRRLDKFNCVEIDECVGGQHSCHENANCLNTQGSYHCECKEGYSGDGYNCEPVCNQTCLHGGQCSKPNECTCRMGFIGKSCEQDLDECATGLHVCKPSSECINMPGWYFCKCKKGYRTLGPECIDIDECSNNSNSCHPTAKCVNTDGHFECQCPTNSLEKCSLNCIFEDNEILDGAVVSPRNKPCEKCTCNKGVITCEEPKCNCSAWNSNNQRDVCCPQCDSNESCKHQELSHVLFKSGEQWLYQCQTCECLYGEFDCWKLQCPPLSCENPLPLAQGDCCPRCPDDPCNHLERSSINSDNNNLCYYKGHQYSSGQIFTDPSSQCTTCGCKDGQLFCSVNNSCTNHSNESTSTTTATTSSIFVSARRQPTYKRSSLSQSSSSLPSSSSPSPPSSISLSTTTAATTSLSSFTTTVMATTSLSNGYENSADLINSTSKTSASTSTKYYRNIRETKFNNNNNNNNNNNKKPLSQSKRNFGRY